MSTSGTTPSYPGQRPSGNANEVRVYETPEKQRERAIGRTEARTGITKKSTSSTAIWWILAVVALAIILYFAMR